jgi:H+/Cl- antiporter ClcA
MPKKFRLLLLEILKITLIGLSIGASISLYRYAVTYVITFSSFLFTSSNNLYFSLGVIGLVVLGIFSYAIIRFDVNIQGSGLPQLEMNLKYRKKNLKWYSIPLMFINSLISFFAGLPLGTEGPSTFMGGMINYSFNRLFKDYDNDDDIPLGMGTGFGISLMTPVAGIFYSFEECLETFQFKYIWKSILMITIAFTVAYLINPTSGIVLPVLSSFNYLYTIDLFLIVLANYCLARVILFLVPLFKSFINNHYKNSIIRARFFIIYIISALILIFCPILSGSGNNLLTAIKSENLPYLLLLSYLIVRIVMYATVNTSMASGGLMVPTFVLGALVGEILYVSFFKTNGSNTNENLIIILSMLSLFTFLNRTPLTNITLAISFGGYMNFLSIIGPSLITIVVSYLISKITKLDTLNDQRRKLLRTSRQTTLKKINQEANN